jgi:hypothetical protein
MSLPPKPLLPSKLAPKLVAKPLVAPKPPQGKLTPTELELLVFLSEGEGGIANYGEKVLAGKVLYQDKKGYQWCEKSKLWKEGNSDILAQGFFNDLRQAIKALEERVEKVSDDKEEHRSFIKESHKPVRGIALMNGIWRKIEGFLSKREIEFNNYSHELPLKGGNKIHLRTGVVSERTSKDFWTYEIGATGVECSEQAKKDNLEYYTNYCTRPDKSVDVELLTYLQDLLGYFMTYEVGDKAFYVILGTGGTGKTQLMKRFGDILTSKRVSTCSRDVFVKPANEGNHNTYYKTLSGLSLAYVSELEDGKPLNGAVMKALSGEDEITYRGAYDRLPTTCKFTCKFVVITNEMFKMDGGDSGLISRLHRILFTNDLEHVPTAQRQINERLIARLKTQDGINATFAWCLEGSMRVLANVENNITTITPPACVVEESAVFAEESDSFKHFLSEKCDICPSPDVMPAYTYPREMFHKAYIQFCKDHNYTGSQRLGKSQRVDRVRSMFPGQHTRNPFIGFKAKEEEQRL